MPESKIKSKTNLKIYFKKLEKTKWAFMFFGAIKRPAKTGIKQNKKNGML